MKKALTRIMSLALVIVTLLTIVPLSASASTSSNKTKIFSYLTQEIGFNSAAACGIMANIERESNFRPDIVARDSNGLYSGGLCMWNGSRFTNLKNYCYEKGYNYLSVEGQLSYLEYELQKSGYTHIYNYLMDVSDTSTGAYNAAYYWCYYFEIPANKAVKAKQRGNMAISSYWPVYGKKSLTKPKLTLAGDTVHFDLNDKITLSWTSGGSNATNYKLYVAKKNPETGKYDWSNSRIYTYSSSTRSQKIDLSDYGIGVYSAYVNAIHSSTDNRAKSNYAVFSVKCKNHTYEAMITKEPTFTSKGVKTYTCTKCAAQKKQSVPALTGATFKNTKMYTPFVTSNTRTAVRLEWQPMAGVTGYMVYLRVNNKWKLVNTVKASDCPGYTVKALTPGTDYKFCVRAYVVSGGKKYYSAVSPSVVTATRTATPTLSKISRGVEKVTVSWNKVSGADGYVVYMATSKNGTYKSVGKVSAGTSSKTITGLTSEKYHYFRVRAYQKVPTGNIFSYASDIKYAMPK